MIVLLESLGNTIKVKEGWKGNGRFLSPPYHVYIEGFIHSQEGKI